MTQNAKKKNNTIFIQSHLAKEFLSMLYTLGKYLQQKL